MQEVRTARTDADLRTVARATAPLTNLKRLEAESIAIMREVVAEAERPVMLYSVGKDSSVMLHLARKAFHPGKPPFPSKQRGKPRRLRWQGTRIRSRSSSTCGGRSIVSDP